MYIPFDLYVYTFQTTSFGYGRNKMVSLWRKVASAGKKVPHGRSHEVLSFSEILICIADLLPFVISGLGAEHACVDAFAAQYERAGIGIPATKLPSLPA